MALDALGRLEAMLGRRGAALPQQPDADALAALQRCKSCNYKKLCDELLASPGVAGYRGFCPNSGYIEALRHKRLAFTKA